MTVLCATVLCVTILRVTLALTVLCFVQVSEEVEAVVRQLVTHVSFSTAVADQITQLQSLEALQTRTWLAEGTAEILSLTILYIRRDYLVS